jgi:peptidyl-tRNA hydrolase
MQMIDVLKRLAELDAKNPSIAKEQAVSEASPYIGDNMLEPPDDKPEWPQMDPAEIVLNVFDPEALENDPNANEWPTIPVTVTYADKTTNVNDPECEITNVINQKTNEVIKFNDLAMGDQDEIVSMCHTDLQNRISDQMSNNRYDLEESSLREGQNKMTNNVNECGMMGGMSQPHSPASINMTADSGSELTGMLRDIMQLAGLKQVGPTDLGHEHEPAVVSAPPTISVATVDDEPNMMRSMIDKLNEPDSSDSDEEAEVKEADNTPDESYVDPQAGPLGVSGPASRDQTGSEKAGKKRHNMNSPVGDPGVTFESLMAEYKKFISEDQDVEEDTGLSNLTDDQITGITQMLQNGYDIPTIIRIFDNIPTKEQIIQIFKEKVMSLMKEQDMAEGSLEPPYDDRDTRYNMESMLKLAGLKK